MMNFLKKLLGISPAFDIAALLQQGAIIIDVRSPAEFKGGHIDGSTNIPLELIAANATILNEKKVPIITVCRSGARSGMATKILKNAGITVFNGGSLDSLQSKIQ